MPALMQGCIFTDLNFELFQSKMIKPFNEKKKTRQQGVPGLKYSA
jgi:hypothetical protein